MSSQNNLEKTEVSYGIENTTNMLLHFLYKTKNSVDVCTDCIGPLLTLKFEQYKKGLIDLTERNIRIRFITEITTKNIHHVKELGKIFNEIRHLDGCKGNFAINETEYISTPSLHEQQQLEKLIYSNIRDIVEQQHYIFDNFWNQAIPAEQKIMEIEEGIEPEFLEVIIDRQKAAYLLLELAKSVKKEALLLLPNDKAIVRADRIGIIDYLIKVSQENNAAVKIICPLSKENSEIIKRIESSSKIKILNGEGPPFFGVLIVDNTKYVYAELKQPKAEVFSEAIGFCLHSNSRQSVESFKGFFELLWNKPVGERTLTEEEVKEYLETVLREVKLNANNKVKIK